MPTEHEPLPPLVVRADANPSIGLGHVMRCLAIAEEWRAQGGEVAFAGHLAGSRAPALIERRGFRLVSIPAPHPDPGDLHVMEQQADARRRPWAVVDGYHFDAGYREGLQSHGYRVASLDDGNGERAEGADVLLNPNAHAERLPIAPSPRTTVLAGPRYCLLRPEFTRHAERARELPAQVRRVLITMGGSDPGRLAPHCVRALQQPGFAQLELVVVSGPDAIAAESMAEDARTVPVTIVRDPDDWPALMRSCDLAVAAAGSTAWELAFCGVPAILIAAASNQAPIARELDARGAAVSLGAASQVTEDQIRGAIAELLGDAARRQRLSEAGRALVDGQGASRVVNILRALSGGAVDWHVREAGAADALSIWRIANDPEVRGRSFTTAPIPLAQHLDWFNAQLSQQPPAYWVADVDGLIAGQVRYSRTSEGVEVHFSVAAPFRGRGLAAELLRHTFDAACERFRAARVHGIAYLDNVASHRAFERAQYRRVGTCEQDQGTCVTFERRCL